MRPTKRRSDKASKQTSASQRIITAARRHFLSHGFRRVTMDDLAEELGMSKKTLYACFPSKIELLKGVLLNKFDDIESDLQQVTGNCADVPTALHELLACVQRHTEEIQSPFVRDIQREAPEMFQLVERRRRDVIQRHFGKLFEQGRRAGIIRKDIPTRLIIEILLGATQAMLNPPKMAELNLTPKTGFSAIITVILQGAL
ncbi:MAG: TetR/AcrR family transcriptional regulator, partial [Nitrospirales bacterium]|nr:TetR/AcrR family transcriptional regulator [Nitrospirales bacterium]